MTQNRRRRADKARRRQQHFRAARPEQPQLPVDQPDVHQLQETIDELMAIVARRVSGMASGAAPFFGRPRVFHIVAGANVLAHYVEQVTTYGWTGTDLNELAKRRLSAAACDFLAAFIDDLRGDRTWQCIRELGGSPTGVDLLIRIAVLCASLPRLPMTAPDSDDDATSTPGTDERMLRKVRALLAKAESTEYGPEAETLTAKAQQLMAKYSIEQSLAESRRPGAASRTRPQLRRMWVDAPYVSPKSSLIGAVARANHCRCVESSEWGFVSLVGHRADLDLVEVLATSLLLQASRAMTLAGAQIDEFGTSQTKSFRHSFLLSFAHRIGQRLCAAAQGEEDEASAATGGALVPVLAARDDAVDAEVEQLFPCLVSRPMRISNARGWGAGRAAADLARLDRRGTIAG